VVLAPWHAAAVAVGAAAAVAVGAAAAVGAPLAISRQHNKGGGVRLFQVTLSKVIDSTTYFAIAHLWSST